MPKVVILDTTSGVTQGGHDPDDLHALTEALAPYQASRLAPFEDRGSLVQSRPWRLILLSRALLHLVRENRECVAVVQSFGRLELLVLLTFTLIFHRRLRSVVVLRRESYGAGWLGFVFRRLINSMIREGRWIFASYSRLVLEFWQKQTGRQGSLLAFPVKHMPPGQKKAHPGALTFGLLGALRWDKGAAHYDVLIEKCLALGDDCRVVVQCYTQNPARPDSGLTKLVGTLNERWSNHERVQLIAESLAAHDYMALLAETDVGLFPYDVQSYGGGDSGVLNEILTMGKIAVATPIPWAKSAFVHHPNLIFIDNPAGETAVSALYEARRRVRAMPRGDAPSRMSEDHFGQSWRAALSRAISA